MKHKKIVNLILIILILFSSKTFGQISSLFRYSNVVYYKTQNLSDKKLRGTNLSFWDRTILNRYFDTLLKNDSLNICIDGKSYLFTQKKRTEPKEYKEIVFYNVRHLKNDRITIKSLKIIDIDTSYIYSEASLYFDNDKKGIIKKELLLPIKEINGIYLGTGKNTRHAFIGSFVVVGIVPIILIISNLHNF